MIRALLDSKSSISSMRLMSFIALIAACLLGGVGLCLGRDLIGLAALCGVFVTAAFGGKVGQKLIESNKGE